MRILFLGQKPIGEKCFDLLKNKQNENYSLICAVSNQEKESVWWKSNSIYEKCKKENIIFIDNKFSNEDIIREIIKKEEINFIISVGHSWILSTDILEMVNYNAVNLHLAKLPEYRGNFTYNHAILNKEKYYGITLHWMVEEVDKGDYIYIKEFPVEQNDTAFSLYEKSVEEGVKLFGKLVEKLCQKEDLPKNPLTGEQHFYSRRSLNGLREIKNQADLEEVERKSKAFYFPPFEPAYYFINNEKYYIIPAYKGDGV